MDLYVVIPLVWRSVSWYERSLFALLILEESLTITV